jgi:dihydrodipicolinate synthase/N-acetylneuraminate lyase
MIVHPTCAPTPRYGIGIPAAAAKVIIEAVPQVVGWKMTYNYDGYRELTRVLRGLERRVSILGAPAVYFHENLATGAFDGTATGSWNYAPEAMLDHIEAWKRGDVETARALWDGGLAQLQEYIYSENTRLHIR